MTKARWALALGVITLVGTSPAGAGQDCSCGPRNDDAVRRMARHKSAFAGRVQAVEPSADALRVTFDVSRVYKGPRAKTLTVSTRAGECGFTFAPGKPYLVFANGDKTALSTDACAGNVDLEQPTSAVRQLDMHSGYARSPLLVR